MEEIEKLRKVLAFYMGELPENNHIIEEEYRELAGMEPFERSEEEVERLVALANALMDAFDASNKAFREELDKWMIYE